MIRCRSARSVNRRAAAGVLGLLAVAGPTACGGVGATSGRTGTVVMPVLVGKNAAVAKDELERLGFGDDRIRLSPQGHMFVAMPSHWTVTDQSEKPGVRVDLRELVVLTVVK